MQNELLLDGELVDLCPTRCCRPRCLTPWSRRARRTSGGTRSRLEIATRYVPKLLAGLPRVADERSPIDAVCDHLVPPLSVLATWTLVVAVVHAMGATLGHRGSRIALAADLTALLALVAHTFAGLVSVGAPAARYRALLSAPRIVVWKVALWAKALRAGDDVEWTRTRRNVEMVP